MIMPRGSELLLPANPVFIAFTLLFALAVNMIPFGRSAAVPDVVAVVLVFWTVHQSRRVGVGIAFMFGLMMDVHSGALLGQHALAYTLMGYLATAMHRRLLWFGWFAQALQLLPLFALAHLVAFLVRLAAGDMLPGWELALAPLFEMLLWPIVTWLLLAPQRRAPDPDQNRPL